MENNLANPLTFVQKLPTQNPSNILDSFDDIVVYGTRTESRSPKE